MLLGDKTTPAIPAPNHAKNALILSFIASK